MAELSLPLITLAIGLPLLGAAVVGTIGLGRRRKFWALLTSAISAISCLEILRESAAAGYAPLAEPWFSSPFFADALSAALLALFALVCVGVLAALSHQDARPAKLRPLLIIQAATLAAYAASNPAVFALAWIACSIPPLLDRSGDRAASGGRRSTEIALFVSCGFLAAGLVYMSWSADGFAGLFSSWASLEGAGDRGGLIAFALLMLAVLFRKGLFPVHAWVIAAHERGDLPIAALLVNGHLSAFLVVRVVIPLFPHIATESLVLITDLAFFTALYAAVLGLSERAPRRILALLLVSQSAFVLAGLETGTPEGISGALVYWMVVTVATTSLAVVLRSIEQRLHHPLTEENYLGLAGPFPRLATFFVVCGVALVGMPGTLGFIADELLLHGALESHPRLGLIMPLAAALNAFLLFRLFSRLFLGSRGPRLTGVPDARLGERLALTAALVLLVVGGLLPARAVGLRSTAAAAIVDRLETSSSHGN